MPDVTSFITGLVNVVLDHPTAIVTFLLSGVGVSVTLQVIKHFGKLQEAKKVVMVLLGALSMAASFADQIIAFGSKHPQLFSPIMGWVIAVAVYFHEFVGSPIYHKVTTFLNGVYADAHAYRTEQAALATQTAPVPDHEFEINQ
jgi:hypothetical protein